MTRAVRCSRICARGSSQIDRRLAGLPPQTVMMVVWLDPLISVGRNTFLEDALRRAGARSIIDTPAILAQHQSRRGHPPATEVSDLFERRSATGAKAAGRVAGPPRLAPVGRRAQSPLHRCVAKRSAIPRRAWWTESNSSRPRSIHPGLLLKPHLPPMPRGSCRNFWPHRLVPASLGFLSHRRSPMKPLTLRRVLWSCALLTAVLFAIVLLALRLGAVPFSFADLGQNLVVARQRPSRKNLHRFSPDHGGYPPAANFAGHRGRRRAFGGRRQLSGAAAESSGRSLRAGRFQRRRAGRDSGAAGRARAAADDAAGGFSRRRPRPSPPSIFLAAAKASSIAARCYWRASSRHRFSRPSSCS